MIITCHATNECHDTIAINLPLWLKTIFMFSWFFNRTGGNNIPAYYQKVKNKNKKEQKWNISKVRTLNLDLEEFIYNLFEFILRYKHSVSICRTYEIAYDFSLFIGANFTPVFLFPSSVNWIRVHVTYLDITQKDQSETNKRVHFSAYFNRLLKILYKNSILQPIYLV